MTDAELLVKIKNGLGITGAFQDETLNVYLDEVKAFMKSAGVSQDVIKSEASVGCIMRGVADLWNYGSGNATLSNYFRMRVIQLKSETVEKVEVEKVAPYLFKKTFDDLDYDNANDYFRKYKPVVGGCSAVRNGNLFGRNYDWYYDEKVSFVTYTPAFAGRHAVLGIASGTSDLTQEFVESGKHSDSYKIVPFMLMDGINDAGLICEINVVPAGDNGVTYGTNAEGADLFALMIPRFVLDHASSVDEAIQLLESRNIYCADNNGVTQEFHFMIADVEKTVVVEFIDNEMNVIEEFVGDKPIMTNLYLTNYDGTRESLTDHAQGIERQAILSAGYDTTNTEITMIALMVSVWFTTAYSTTVSPLWYSDFSGGDLTKDSTPEEYEPVMEIARNLFANRQRDGKTWQTVHTSVYNIADKRLTVIPQESGEMFSFKLEV